MRFKRKSFTGHFSLILLLMIASIVLSACDFTSSPEGEETLSFDEPPIVRIETPLNGDTYQEGVGVNILARVENAGPDISRVSIQVDGIIVGEQTSPNTSGAASFTINTGWPATGVGQHTINVSANRSNGMVSAPASVTINVVAASTGGDGGAVEQTGTDVEAPTEDTAAQQVVPTLTFPPAPTAQPTITVIVPTNTPAPPTATPTPAKPRITVVTGANVRSGAGTVFEPPVGSLAAGAVADILAVNTAGTWYKIQYYNGEAWISAVVVTTSGDLSTLPRDNGPATPIPVTNTPVATATPVTQIDLIIDGANSAVIPTFVCNKASEIRMTVVNAGSQQSPGSVLIIEDVYKGQVGANTQASIPALAPGQSYTTSGVYLTVNTNFGEGHTFRARADGNNQVAETNEGNNQYVYDYVLETGGC